LRGFRGALLATAVDIAVSVGQLGITRQQSNTNQL